MQETYERALAACKAEHEAATQAALTSLTAAWTKKVDDAVRAREADLEAEVAAATRERDDLRRGLEDYRARVRRDVETSGEAKVVELRAEHSRELARRSRDREASEALLRKELARGKLDTERAVALALDAQKEAQAAANGAFRERCERTLETERASFGAAIRRGCF